MESQITLNLPETKPETVRAVVEQIAKEGGVILNTLSDHNMIFDGDKIKSLPLLGTGLMITHKIKMRYYSEDEDHMRELILID